MSAKSQPDMTAICAECGAEYGVHDGRKCFNGKRFRKRRATRTLRFEVTGASRAADGEITSLSGVLIGDRGAEEHVYIQLDPGDFRARMIWRPFPGDVRSATERMGGSAHPSRKGVRSDRPVGGT